MHIIFYFNGIKHVYLSTPKKPLNVIFQNRQYFYERNKILLTIFLKITQTKKYGQKRKTDILTMTIGEQLHACTNSNPNKSIVYKTRKEKCNGSTNIDDFSLFKTKTSPFVFSFFKTESFLIEYVYLNQTEVILKAWDQLWKWWNYELPLKKMKIENTTL